MSIGVKRRRAVRRWPSSNCSGVLIGSHQPITQRLYNKVLSFVKGFLIISMILVMTATIITTHMSRNPELEVTHHRVSSGESLWSIAEEYKPDGMSMGDYMAWVYEHNDGGMIYPGDVVVMGIKG